MFNHYDGKVIKYEKIADDRNLVILATAYDHNCSDQDTIEVSDAVLAVMLGYELNENKYGRNQRNHTKRMPETDYEAAKKGLVLPSAEEVYIAEEDKEKMLKVFSHLSGKQRRRLYLMFKENHTYDSIAALEGVGITTIRDSIKGAMKQIKKHGEFILTSKARNWMDLLIIDES